MFTICCTGAHLLPNTGNENILPTTATAPVSYTHLDVYKRQAVINYNSVDIKIKIYNNYKTYTGKKF